MCTTELDCLNTLVSNSYHLKAFFYALAVLIALILFMWAINKILSFTIGKTW